ncbi:MAG: hypothetical protein MJZ37_07475 [Bacilli bacterium]|nr:hypothetical protein [Bacilli bacterium]
MAKKEKKYVVAKGYSFTSGGHIYVAGEEISEKIFADKKDFASCISKGSIKEIMSSGDATTDNGKPTGDATTDNGKPTGDATADNGESTSDATADNSESTSEGK